VPAPIRRTTAAFFQRNRSHAGVGRSSSSSARTRKPTSGRRNREAA
jgi:hypothetical protein